MLRYCYFALVFGVMAGCGPDKAVEPAPTAFDAGLARETLIKALDAWKLGQARGLARLSPPIRFSDDDFVSGKRLVAYDLARPDEPIVAGQDVAVVLSLKDAQGKISRREASYQVVTNPSLGIMRSDP